MKPPLETLLEQAAYETFQESNPKLLRLIEQLIAAGESPEKIFQKLGHIRNTQTGRFVYYAACHCKKLREQAKVE